MTPSSTAATRDPDLHTDARGRLRILRLELELGWENAPYNQFSLPVADQYDITFSTYFRAPIRVSDTIELVEGDGTFLGYVKVLRKTLRVGNFDLVHAHTPHVGCFFLAARLLFGARHVPTVFTVHNSYPSFKFRNKLLLLPVFAFFRRVVCCSRSSLESFPRIYRWLAGRRLCAIENGVDLARVDRTLREQASETSSSEFTVLSVGRLISIKNPFTLLNAFRLGSNGEGRLLYVGEGTLRDELASRIHRMAMTPRVTLLGRVSRERVFQEAASASVFVSCSFGEGLPLSVLEAMACGCPVILSNIGPHREIAGDSDAIPLVPPSDLDGFAREIDRFHRMEKSEQARIGRKCRQIVEKRFGLARMLSRYDRLYREAVDDQSRQELIYSNRPVEQTR